MAYDNLLELTIELEDGTTLGLYHLRGRQRFQQVRATMHRNAECQATFPFIDVVRTDPHTGKLRFAGASLAQFIAARQDWDPDGVNRLMQALESCRDDLRAFVHRLANPEKRETFIHWPRIPFVSGLACEIARRGPPRASAGHWRALVRGLGSAGIRGDEILWSGLSDRLDALPADAVLTRGAVRDLIDLTFVTPRVVNRAVDGFFSTAGWRHCHEPLTTKEVRRANLPDVPPSPRYTAWFRHRALGWRAVHVEFRDLFDNVNERWIVLDDRGRRALDLNVAFANSSSACAWAEREMAREFASWPIRKQVHQWTKHAVSGGGAYEESLFQLDDFVNDFWSHHFIPVRNVLLHVRWSLQTSHDGRRLLFLDEVQSDWHRLRGTLSIGLFGREIPDAPFRKEWPLLALKVMLWRAQELGCDGLAISTGELQLRRWAEYGPPTSLYDRTLVHEARSLARLLGMGCGNTTITAGSVNGPESTESGADTAQGSASTQDCNVPVFWLEGVPQLRAIPLFGLGRREDWFDPPAAASIRAPLPMQSRSRIARIRTT